MRDLKLIGTDLYVNVCSLDGVRSLLTALAASADQDTAAASEVLEATLDKLGCNISVLASEIGGQEDV